ncbi:MAG: polyisoprenoid-binding protein YceI [Saprospiraceae bacterium]|jgi:polyisoprenoid-binding protein YceI
MKNLIFVLFTLVSFSLTAANDNPTPITKSVNVETSVINWTGKKVTGQHSGDIKIKEGSLSFEGGKLIGGSFVIDMNSMKCTDLQGKSAKKLEGHLMSDDFFGIPNHPTATLEITKVKESKKSGNYEVTANITIKGITKTIIFETTVGANNATANVIINRTDFDIKYGSGSFFDNLGDKTIYDDFELALDLKF